MCQFGRTNPRRFWQPGGGFDNNATEPQVLVRRIEYIQGNPVRRELVTRAEEWKRSSAGWGDGKNSLMPEPIDLGGLVGYFRGKE